MSETAIKLEITELVNKLFMYTDERRWNDLLKEVFTTELWFDMSSMGAGEAGTISAKDLCTMWDKGFEGLDAIHHQSGQYLISIEEEEADIFAYATATHYKKAATKGHIRTFVGSYNLEAVRTPQGWRLDLFRYNLKYADGNVTLV
jgi:hypothetical protein